MTNLIIEKARIEDQGPRGFHVMHPSNSAILAYCSTEEEARRCQLALQVLGRELRAGH